MSERSRFIKVRLSDSEYQDLRRRADEAGLTMSEQVRGAVTAVNESVDVVSALDGLRDAVRQGAGDDLRLAEPHSAVSMEVLLLVRELAAARDAQILSRVRAQLAAQSQRVNAAGGRHENA
jgi:hypothetical protein